MIRVHLDRISDSCGFGVPLMEFVATRPQRERWLETQGRARASASTSGERNAASIDGLPAFDAEPVPAD